MMHLTAYARTLNPGVIVVAGGPAVRALPLLSQHRFDYACLGDIEELQEVVRDAWRAGYTADEMIPRYDTADWLGRTGYVEATRYCNFRCAFCSLTGEGRKYQNYDARRIRQQFIAASPRKRVFFLDNNFYGSSREQFRARIELLKKLRAEGYFRTWSALVTNDFFHHDENLAQARESGCELLFSGVESFDEKWLRAVNKRQIVTAPQVTTIRKCLDAGIVFSYGLILDVTSRPIAELRRELDYIMGSPEITLPAFASLPIPILGTPYFFEALRRRSILPSTRLRDLDGTTITQQTLDPIDEAAAFVADLQSFRGLRLRAAKHALGFARRYRSKLSWAQMAMALGSTMVIGANKALTAIEGGSSKQPGAGPSSAAQSRSTRYTSRPFASIRASHTTSGRRW
jgi:hypothetical protein